MSPSRFGWPQVLEGVRFWAPVSEETLVEAGRAAGLHEGATVLELACGNGAVAVFLAEEFHVYARGLDASRELVELARVHAERSPAAHRIRFFQENPVHPEPHGPVDLACALRPPAADPGPFARPGGCVLVGRFVATSPHPPAAIAESFPLETGEPPGRVRWRRTATPLEWERFWRPQERALRAHREKTGGEDETSTAARQAAQRIEAFRAHGAHVAYELVVAEV